MNSFQYDIALSFAEEDVDIALCFYLALKLEQNRTSTFYYKEDLNNSGKSLMEELPKVYGKRSRFVIMIVSKNYINKDKTYTPIEIKAIMKRWHKNKEKTFLIPIITDDTTLSEIHEDLGPDIAYLSWNHEPEKLAQLIWEMLGKKQGEAKKIANMSHGKTQHITAENVIYAARDITGGVTIKK